MALGDRRLVARAQRGERPAQEALAVRLRPDLHNLFLWLTRDPEQAETLTQETLLRFWSRLPQFRGESSLRTWAHTIALSLLSEQRRSEGREAEALARYARETLPEPSAEQERRAELRVALAQALASLPDPERRVIVLCKLQGFTLAEASRLLGEPVGTLAWRSAEALKKLRMRLSDEPSSAPQAPPNLTKEVQPDVPEGS